MAHEFDGKKYEKASAHQKEWGSRIISELDLKREDRVLDLGCGDGELTCRIAERLPQGDVLGIDASKGMIEAALPKEQSNLHFIKMDIDDIHFDRSFDVVFSNAALHWVKDHGRLLHTVYKALRPGGRIRFNFAGNGNCSNFFFIVRQAMAHKDFEPFYARFDWPWYMPTVKEYQRLVESSPFRHVRIWGETADRLFPDSEAMIRWIDQPSLVPFLGHIPDSAKKPFRDFVVNGMVGRTKQSDGQCFETFRRINVSAVK